MNYTILNYTSEVWVLEFRLLATKSVTRPLALSALVTFDKFLRINYLFDSI